MFISPAYAQAAEGGASMIMQMAPLVLIFVVFYFLLIRPQQKKVKEHKAMLDAVKRGDVVVTNGGIIGKVVTVDGNEMGLELAPNVRVKAVKGMIAEVRSKTEPASGGGGGGEAKAVKPKEEGAYYKALGLKADASAADIAAAAAAKTGDAAAQDAIETLKDPVKRKLYDSLGHDEYLSRIKG
ncbi:MAG: preprotein translocase subunit YajC [Alphaproteobacteria bacterium]|nr:preprotein translocase subunit YajC [Alphaproteobacteria bacterium]